MSKSRDSQLAKIAILTQRYTLLVPELKWDPPRGQQLVSTLLSSKIQAEAFKKILLLNESPKNAEAYFVTESSTKGKYRVIVDSDKVRMDLAVPHAQTSEAKIKSFAPLPPAKPASMETIKKVVAVLNKIHAPLVRGTGDDKKDTFQCRWEFTKDTIVCRTPPLKAKVKRKGSTLTGVEVLNQLKNNFSLAAKEAGINPRIANAFRAALVSDDQNHGCYNILKIGNSQTDALIFQLAHLHKNIKFKEHTAAGAMDAKNVPTDIGKHIGSFLSSGDTSRLSQINRNTHQQSVKGKTLDFDRKLPIEPTPLSADEDDVEAIQAISTSSSSSSLEIHPEPINIHALRIHLNDQFGGPTTSCRIMLVPAEAGMFELSVYSNSMVIEQKTSRTMGEALATIETIKTAFGLPKIVTGKEGAYHVRITLEEVQKISKLLNKPTASPLSKT